MLSSMADIVRGSVGVSALITIPLFFFSAVPVSAEMLALSDFFFYFLLLGDYSVIGLDSSFKYGIFFLNCFSISLMEST